jgi:hypothetical protein
MFPDEEDIMTVLYKLDSEFFDEESNVVHKLINVRRIELPQNGEDWEILEDNKVMFTVKGVKLTKKQRSFLRSLQGISSLMELYKEGQINMNKIKNKINKLL